MQPEKIETKSQENDDEISLVDIIQFFIRKKKSIALTTVGLSALAIGYSFLQAPVPQYKQDLSLSISPNTSITQVKVLDVVTANTAATKSLNNNKEISDSVNLSASYNQALGEIALTVKSSNTENIKAANTQVLEHLQEKFEQETRKEAMKSLSQIEIELNREKAILAEIEEQMNQALPEQEKLNLENLSGIYLKEQRVITFSNIAGLQFDRQYLEKMLKSSEEFSAEIYPIEITQESEIGKQSSRSLKQITILSTIASFMVAVLIAIVQDQIPQIRSELSRRESSQKIDREAEHSQAGGEEK